MKNQIGFSIRKGMLIMKKNIKELMLVFIAYVGVTIYGYFNSSSPLSEYSWLISAVIIFLLYVLFKLIEHRDNKKNKNK